MCEWQRKVENVCLWGVKVKGVVVYSQIKGRLKEMLDFWRDELEAPAFILDVIEHGYVLPLKSEPTPFIGKNQASVFDNEEFESDSLEELLVAGCIQQVAFVPYACSPLSVVKCKFEEKRLVLNLRDLNKFLWKQKFKYEDLRTAMLLLEKGDYMFAFDLKSGYHHVDIADVHHKYLGFAWKEKFYVFTVLSFGLASA